MPHLLVEYSKNIADRLSLQAFSDELRDATMATGTYPLGGVRVRFHECSTYTIADSNNDDDTYAFVHIQLRMGEGRSHDEKLAASTLIFERAKSFVKEAFDIAPSALSLEIVEIDARYSHKHNLINAHLKTKE